MYTVKHFNIFMERKKSVVWSQPPGYSCFVEHCMQYLYSRTYTCIKRLPHWPKNMVSQNRWTLVSNMKLSGKKLWSFKMCGFSQEGVSQDRYCCMWHAVTWYQDLCPYPHSCAWWLSCKSRLQAPTHSSRDYGTQSQNRSAGKKYSKRFSLSNYCVHLLPMVE